MNRKERDGNVYIIGQRHCDIIREKKERKNENTYFRQVPVE